jgi:hypothetical protein
MATIKFFKARSIYDSRGNPTVEVRLLFHGKGLGGRRNFFCGFWEWGLDWEIFSGFRRRGGVGLFRCWVLLIWKDVDGLRGNKKDIFLWVC